MNRLGQEKSAYLRQHAGNPVDWFPWGDEALQKARGEDRPILLSIGYSACHWCHVMAHESFEDPDTAAVMNELFVNIKVDREERPDVDQLYQGVVQLMGRGGGWPLTVFLTPDLRPFYGGTYFPKGDRYGLPGFVRLLRLLHAAFTNEPDKVEEQAREFVDGLGQLATHGLDAPPRELTAGDLVGSAKELEQQLDPISGGFGGAPKFPSPMTVQLLLRGHRRGAGERLRDSVRLTLEKMARGGLYDQLGGGFHRYSTDERWLVPHFEKMLYDNAQLLHLYAEAQQVMPDALWRKVAEETVEYVRREMTSPQGGFYATQDADSEGEEGRFFVWRPEELDALLPDGDATLLKEHLGVTAKGNFEHGRTVLSVVKDVPALASAAGLSEAEVEAKLRAARRVLFEARERRVKPGRDEKILAGWNGLMIRGLAFASRTFGRPEWVPLARGAADFLLRELWDGRRLWRLYQEGRGTIPGFLEDHGMLAAGLTALYQVTFDAKYLEAAAALARQAVELFWDGERGAYLTAPRGQRDLVTATYALHDNATPSGASSLTEAQVALAALTGDASHLEQAGRYLAKMAEPMVRNPFAFGHLWLAADAYLDGAAEVTVVGDEAARRPLVEVLSRVYAPTFSVLEHDPGRPAPPIVAAVLEGRSAVQGSAAAYVCRSFACDAPVAEPAALEQKLRQG